MGDDEGKSDADWSRGTWEGARREQIRRWRKLSLREKLDAVDELTVLGAQLINARKAKGLPYVDPTTGERVTKRDVAEQPARYGKKS